MLANEQVVDGGCWRCGTPVETRDLEQWFFRITAYADELLDATAELTAVAREGPDDAAELDRAVGRRSREVSRSRTDWTRRIRRPDPTDIEVFTTRIDTIFGATFVLLGPEHPLVSSLCGAVRRSGGVQAKAQAFRMQDRAARISGEIEKQGFDTGFRAINPFTNQPVPVWVANFVLGEYGTGAVMAVPAHDERDFEFARKFNLPIRVVVTADGKSASSDGMTEATPAYGTLVDSGEFSGLSSENAQKRMIACGEAARHRRRHHSVPPEGLGHLAAAVLGHAHPDDLLREGRDRARAGRSASG